MTIKLEALESAAERTARALVRRPDVKVVSSGNAAAWQWSTKTLFVPAYSVREDATDAHVWAFRGVLDHECAHVVHSDCESLDVAIGEWREEFGDEAAQKILLFANVFEDWFIEREWVKSNPGSVKHLRTMHEVTVRETGGAGPCWPTFKPNGWASPPVGPLFALMQAMLRVELGLVRLDEVCPDIAALMRELSPQIHAGRVAQSTVDVIAAATALWRRLLELIPPQPKPESDEAGEGPCDGDEEGDGEDPNAGEDGDDGDDGGQGGDGDGDDAGDDAGECDDAGDGDDAGEGAGEGAGDGDGDDAGDAGEGAGDDAGDGGGDAAGESAVTDGDNPQAGDAGEGGYGGGMGDTNETAESTGLDGPKADGTAQAEAGNGNASEAARDVASAGMSNHTNVKSASEVIAEYAGGDAQDPYTVSPSSRAGERWVRYSAQERQEGMRKVEQFRRAAGTASKVLANYTRQAWKSKRQSVWIGGLEDGPDLDPDALPTLAGGRWTSRMYGDTVTGTDDNTFVCVLVDCSGSMGSNDLHTYCPTHGRVNQSGDKCSRPGCRQKLDRSPESPAAHAAIAATAVHDALRECRVPHAVLGYTARWNTVAYESGDVHTEKKKWSQHTNSNVMLEFVPAPGLQDRGGALAHCTGIHNNLDGESLIAGCKYSVQHAGDAKRIVVIVIADGLPAGADGSNDKKHLADMVERAATAGIEVYGIGVGLYPFAQKAFAGFYPNRKATADRAPTGHVLVGADGLDGVLMRQLSRLLLGGSGSARRG